MRAAHVPLWRWRPGLHAVQALMLEREAGGEKGKLAHHAQAFLCLGANSPGLAPPLLGPDTTSVKCSPGTAS